MSYEEFGKISEQNKWGGCPGREFWPDIEEVYMNTTFTKVEMADLYWNHTGYFEQLARIIRDRHEAYDVLAKFGQSLIEKTSEIRANVPSLKGKVAA